MILQAEQVTKAYSNHVALNQASIHVPQGTIYGLLGPNGAGKTTLLRIVNQITAPDSGKVYFNGRPIQPDDIYKIGYLPEERGLYRKMKVGEQALYLAQLKGMKKAEAMHRIKNWFVKFNIEGWWNKKVEELSKGMQQKIQFITTVIHEPELLIFDEPFSGFDPINAQILKEEILELKNRGATVIFSTHNMNSVEELCDNISLINNSKNIMEGNINEIKNRYKTNTFELEYSGTISDSHLQLLDIYETKAIYNGTYIRFSIKREMANNQLLSLLVPEVQINMFREVLPTMNEIFIKAVNDSKTAA